MPKLKNINKSQQKTMELKEFDRNWTPWEYLRIYMVIAVRAHCNPLDKNLHMYKYIAGSKSGIKAMREKRM